MIHNTLNRHLAVGVVLGLLTLPATAHATRPFVTDDARIVDPRGCQIETWFQYHPDSDQQEFWALPACNPTERIVGGVELTAGIATFRDDNRETHEEVIVQAKTLFRELKPNDMGWGLVVGTAFRTGESSPFRDTEEGLFTWIPISVAINEKQTVLHNNLRVHYNRFTDRRSEASFTWGIGIEHWVGERFQLVGETFGESHRESPFWQAGVRGWIVPERVQVDATLGSQFDGDTGDRWFTVGLRLLTPEHFF